MQASDKQKAGLVDVCHRIYARGFVTATDGNVSLRLENGNFLTTRTSVNKGMVTADDLVEVGPDGEPLTKLLRPSTELGMHLFIYRERPDVSAVVHAHPIYATGFAAARHGRSDSSPTERISQAKSRARRVTHRIRLRSLRRTRKFGRS